MPCPDCQSVASLQQRTAAAAAGVGYVSVPRTLWLCRIACNNTGGKQALI